MKFRRIGFIKSLYYYLINPYWEIFFSFLGFQPTYADISRAELPSKTNIFENELCLPVKHFLAQASVLIDSDVDFIFCPLTASLKKGVFCCPKVIMATELIKLYYPQLDEAKLIAPIFADPYYGMRTRFRFFKQTAFLIGDHLGLDKPELKQACKEAESAQEFYVRNLVKSKLFYEEGIKLKTKKIKDKTPKQPSILLLGHSYTVHNSVLNNHLVIKLKKLGANPIAKEHVNNGQTLTAKNLLGIDADFYFSEAAEIFQAASVGAKSDGIQGIIYVSMFNCGFDAVMEDIIQKKFIKSSSKPYLNLVIDEHTTTSNLLAKIEVFMDLIGVVNND